MTFKTQAEIYQALLDGERIRKAGWCDNVYICLVCGVLKNQHGLGFTFTFTFDDPESWHIYEEPKKKRKLWRWRLETEDDVWMTAQYYGEDGRSKYGGRHGCWESFVSREKHGEPVEVDEIPQK